MRTVIVWAVMICALYSFEVLERSAEIYLNGVGSIFLFLLSTLDHEVNEVILSLLLISFYYPDC